MQVTPIQTRWPENHTYEPSKYKSEDHRPEPNTKQLVFPSRPAHTERHEDPTQDSLWHHTVVLYIDHSVLPLASRLQLVRLLFFLPSISLRSRARGEVSIFLIRFRGINLILPHEPRIFIKSSNLILNTQRSGLIYYPI